MTIKACRIPLSFDAARLQADLAQIPATDWIPHFNSQYHDGGWSGAALRAIGGAHTRLYSDPLADRGAYADTPLLARCPGFREALAAFKCPLQSVRLLKIAAGCGIKEHTDYNLGFEDGEIRLHIPVTTNPDVDFYLDGRRLVMNEAECWYLDFNLPHRVHNRGTTDRIHLVIDCAVDEWIRSLFSSAECAQFDAQDVAWQQFRELVLGDCDLQGRLREPVDRETFISLTVQVGREHGFAFSDDEVRAGLRASQRLWSERRLAK